MKKSGQIRYLDVIWILFGDYVLATFLGEPRTSKVRQETFCHQGD